MNYPAIVYSLDDIDPVYANGGVYLSPIKYSVIVIDDDPDTIIFFKILAVLETLNVVFSTILLRQVF